MKRVLKIIAVLLGVILLFAATLFVINIVNLSIMNDYVDTFPAVEIDNKLEPQYDKDGIPYFTTDGDFRVMQLTDLHIGGGILSHNEDKLALNAVAAMISEEKPDLVIITGNVGESGDIVFPSKTDVELFETVLELGSTRALFFGHDHLNNFIIEYHGIKLCYGHSIDYLAYDDIDGAGYQRGCLLITCDENGDATIKHENYYQDKYKPLYGKEEVDMSKDALK